MVFLLKLLTSWSCGFQVEADANSVLDATGVCAGLLSSVLSPGCGARSPWSGSFGGPRGKILWSHLPPSEASLLKITHTDGPWLPVVQFIYNYYFMMVQKQKPYLEFLNLIFFLVYRYSYVVGYSLVMLGGD